MKSLICYSSRSNTSKQDQMIIKQTSLPHLNENLSASKMIDLFFSLYFLFYYKQNH